MDRLRYLETGKGLVSVRRRRRLERLLFKIEQEPASKNAKRAEQQQFQRLVADQMRSLKRRAFRSPIALDLAFETTAPNPPEIHTLAKNYLDLLERVDSDLDIDRTRLFYANDQIVGLLTVRYWPNIRPAAKGTIWIRAEPLRNVAADLHLAHRIQRGDFDSRAGSRWSDAEETLREAERDELSSEAWQSKPPPSWLSPEAKRAWNKMNRQGHQRATLKRNDRLVASMVADILALSSPDIRPELRQGVFDAATAMFRGLLLTDPITLEVMHAPSSSGESKAFKQVVRKTLERFRHRHPWFQPLETPLSVTILYLPNGDGAREDHNVLDLDNLCRKLLPVVNEVLKPPLTLLHTLEPVDVTGGGHRRHIEQMLAAYRSVPRVSVTKYQAVKLQRTRHDPPKGFVRLSFGDGLDHGSMFGAVDDLLDTWEDEVDDS